jgi:hypothetical protein
MDWKNSLNKNNKTFEIKKNKEEKEDNNNNNKKENEQLFIKDYENEFDMKYSSDINDIYFDLKEYCREFDLPFFDKNNYTENNFYHFIKYNCKNVNEIKNKIVKENEETLKEMEEENEIEYENSNDIYNYKN